MKYRCAYDSASDSLDIVSLKDLIRIGTRRVRQQYCRRHETYFR